MPPAGLVVDGDRLLERGAAGGRDGDLDLRGAALLDRVDGGVGDDARLQRRVGLAVHLDAVDRELAGGADRQGERVAPHLRSGPRTWSMPPTGW